MSTLSTVNVFFCGSGLHYLASEKIASVVPPAYNVLFYYRSFVGEVVHPERWDRCEYLPWPRFDPLPGIAGKWRRALANLHRLDNLPASIEQIRLYAPVIDAEVINYFINYLRTRYPDARLAVSIIPDGLMNVQRHPLKLGKRINQRFQKLRGLLTPALRYYAFSGDRAGTDADVVDEIWLLPGLPHEYPHRKVRVLPPLADQTAAPVAGAKRALVLSQPLLQLKSITQADVDAIGDRIHRLLEEEGVQEVRYKAHPRDKQDLLFAPGYHKIELKEPVETHIARERYDVIVGVATTTLLLARGLSPSSRIAAVGLERVEFPNRRAKQRAIDAFVHAGVELIPA